MYWTGFRIQILGCSTRWTAKVWKPSGILRRQSKTCTQQAVLFGWWQKRNISKARNWVVQVFGASSVAAWAATMEKGIQLLEKVQGECLRRILGAKKHSSTEALNVIANVLPIRVRIQELCTREYVRILQKPIDSNIHLLLASTTSIRNRFTPLSYIKYLARDFQRSLGNMEIEKEGKVSDSITLDDIPVHLLPLAADLGGTSTRTLEQKAEGRKRAECFVEEHRGQSVMIFTDPDGSVNDEYAAIVIPLESHDSERQESSAKLTNQRVSYAFTSIPFSFHACHILPTSKFQRSYCCILLTFYRHQWTACVRTVSVKL